MSAPNLIIGSIVLADRSRWNYSQSYEDLRAKDVRRLADGSLNVRQLWSGKIRTVIRGEGKLPLALATLDTSSAITVQCASPRHVGGASTSITLPAGRRSGGIYAPIAWAVVDGDLVSTTISITGNVATLGAVASAESYQVAYFPSISADVTIESDEMDQGNGTYVYRWQITAEEI